MGLSSNKVLGIGLIWGPDITLRTNHFSFILFSFTTLPVIFQIVWSVELFLAYQLMSSDNELLGCLFYYLNVCILYYCVNLKLILDFIFKKVFCLFRLQTVISNLLLYYYT